MRCFRRTVAVIMGVAMFAMCSLDQRVHSESECARGIRFDEILNLVRAGNRQIDDNDAAAAFGTAANCSPTSFSRTVHSDTLGCKCCVTFDVETLSGCRSRVRTVYVTYSGHSQGVVEAECMHLIKIWLPAGTTVQRFASPSSSPKFVSTRLVYRKDAKTYEVHLDIHPSSYGWTGAATLFDY
jgi:hypothetical protein